MEKETVVMVAPDGERRTVAAEPRELIPLMANGWRQEEPLEAKIDG